jgi:hypothetical protein
MEFGMLSAAQDYGWGLRRVVKQLVLRVVGASFF